VVKVSADQRRQAFSIWLRTGRFPNLKSADGIEIKFNPWHNPQNGQFTFANTGRYVGRWDGGGFTGGGGGSFGGGGSSGSNPRIVKPAKRPAPHARYPSPARRLDSQKPASNAATDRSKFGRQQPTPAPELQHVLRNGYKYQIDVSQRTRRVSGTLTLNSTQRRSRRAQAQAGGADRRYTDDGGHYIARRFNGPREAFNHFAQDRNFNRGDYRALEDEWARAKRSGKHVWVRIVPVFDGSSQRPSAINVWFTIDGREGSQKFPNERKEATRGKR
jgi:hypothetical protein